MIARALGYRRDVHDHRDTLVTPPTGTLPESCDELPRIILDQGQVGRCVAASMVGAVLASEILAGKVKPALGSIDWVYRAGREIERSFPDDAGMMPRTACQVVTKVGLPSADIWPQSANIDRANRQPPAVVVRDAYDAKKAISYQRCTDVLAVMHALANGMTVIFGLDVTEAYCSENPPPGTVIGLPAVSDIIAGGHCQRLIRYRHWDGHNLANVQFLCLNSWGGDWGDNGAVWMTSDLVASGSDMWAIK